ncbi:MAG: hypothetical protein ACFFBD_02950 [Candidatus Hodarchaeota archaeon]
MEEKIKNLKSELEKINVLFRQFKSSIDDFEDKFSETKLILSNQVRIWRSLKAE